MPSVIELSQLSVSDTAARFEGRDHGSTVSFFVTRHPPGGHVPLHVHPYEETFVVLEGKATFSVGGEPIIAHGGQALVVPARTAHGFANSGDEDLRTVSIHPADHVEQEWLPVDAR
jgi:quercetin dioxygenase-like cupin family protein